jgi:enoyl-CoA hydratase
MDANKDVVQLTTHESRILQISLNRPEQLNALSRDVLERLSQLFNEIKQDNTIKAILLTGEGKGFCAGADIKQLADLNANNGKTFAEFGQQVFNQLEQIGKPSLAAIHGFAFGGGCELAMAATLRMAANNTVLGQPEIKLGLIPGFGGTQRLARLIGKGRALEVCLTGRRISADEAYQWGLVNELTSPENLLARAISLLNELTKFSAIAMQSMLTVIREGYDMPLIEALALEAAQFGLCCASADKREGVQAFLEKRSAVFNDH